MASVWWKSSYNGVALSTYGLVHDAPGFYITSPMAFLTHGFIIRLNDIWQNWDSENIQNVTWIQVYPDLQS